MRGRGKGRAISDLIWFYIKYPIPATILTLIFIIAYFILRYRDQIFLAIPAVTRMIIFLLIFVLGPIALIYVLYHYILKKSSDDYYYAESDDEMSDYKICRNCGEYFLPQKSYYHTCPDCFQPPKYAPKTNRAKTKENYRYKHSKDPYISPKYKICRECGRTFEPTQPHHHTCPECFQKFGI